MCYDSTFFTKPLRYALESSCSLCGLFSSFVSFRCWCLFNGQMYVLLDVILPVSRSRPPCPDVQRYSCACPGRPSSVRVGFDRGCTHQQCLLPEKLTYCLSPENRKDENGYKQFLNSILLWDFFLEVWLNIIFS